MAQAIINVIPANAGIQYPADFWIPDQVRNDKSNL